MTDSTASTIKIAFVGYGRIAETGHTEALLGNKHYEVCAVFDIVPARLKVARDHFPNCGVYTTLLEMLRQEQPDMVTICAPPVYHYDAIVTCLSKGCHVICEKPLLLNGDQYPIIKGLASKVGKLVYPCHNYKFVPAILRARQAILAGDIGRPKHVLVSVFRALHAKGTPDWQPDWRRDHKISGGGVLTDHGVHCIYLSIFLTGEYPVASVAVFERDIAQASDVEDTAALTMRFPNAVSQVYMTWSASGRYTNYRIDGTLGYISIDDEMMLLRKSTGETVKEDVNSSRFDDPGHSTWYKALYADAFARIQRLDSTNALLNEAQIATHIVQNAYSNNSVMTDVRLPKNRPLHHGLL